MTARGTVKGNVVILDPATPLPDGTEVEVIALPEMAEPINGIPVEKGSFADTFREFIGCMDDLPEDFAENHDHYIHGTEKRVP